MAEEKKEHRENSLYSFNNISQTLIRVYLGSYMCCKRKETRQDGVFPPIQNGLVFQMPLNIFFSSII